MQISSASLWWYWTSDNKIPSRYSASDPRKVHLEFPRVFWHIEHARAQSAANSQVGFISTGSTRCLSWWYEADSAIARQSSSLSSWTSHRSMYVMLVFAADSSTSRYVTGCLAEFSDTSMRHVLEYHPLAAWCSKSIRTVRRNNNYTSVSFERRVCSSACFYRRCRGWLWATSTCYLCLCTDVKINALVCYAGSDFYYNAGKKFQTWKFKFSKSSLRTKMGSCVWPPSADGTAAKANVIIIVSHLTFHVLDPSSYSFSADPASRCDVYTMMLVFFFSQLPSLAVPVDHIHCARWALPLG